MSRNHFHKYAGCQVFSLEFFRCCTGSTYEGFHQKPGYPQRVFFASKYLTSSFADLLKKNGLYQFHLAEIQGVTGETRDNREVEKNLAGMACPFCIKKGYIKSCNVGFQAVTQGHKMCGTPRTYSD